MTTQNLFLSFAILASSFWGSWHCAAMCSPIASLMAKKNSLWSYHLGRGFSYTVLGALGGYLGSFFLQNDFYYVRIVSGALFAIILFFMGVQMLRGKKITPFKLTWLHSYYTKQAPGFVLGLLSIFLPCGWLYNYVLAATATQSPASGALVMSLFWLGGLPSLSAISLFMKKTIQMSPLKKQKLAGFVLVFASLYSVMSFYFLSSSCH